MESKQKLIQLRHKAHLEQKLKDRLAFLAGKGLTARKAEKDTIARKWKADIKAINNRLRLIADHEKRTEEMAKIRADKAAAPKEEAAPKKKEAAKGEKSAKRPEEGKEKKVKAEKKAAPPKAPEGEKG